MNNTFKSKKKYFIILAALGLILLCVGIVMGGSLYSIPSIFSETSLPEGAQSLEHVKPSDIKAIELRLINSDITIKRGKIFAFSGTGLSNNYVRDGVLYAGASDTKNSTKVLGMKLKVDSKWVCGYGSYVLTIPKKASLENISIQTTNCDINGDALNAEKLDISMKAGKLSIDDVSADTLNISSNGSIQLQKVKVDESGTIHAFRNISIGNDTNLKSSMNNLSLSSTVGKIALFGKIYGESQVETGIGNVTASLSGSSDNYTFHRERGKLNIDSAAGAKTSSEHYGNLTVTCRHGKSNISFY